MSKVTETEVKQALAIRASGGTWLAVEQATGFNGATLRPHIARYQHRLLDRAPVSRESGDRADSPLATILSVEPTPESITAARARGMAWYSISDALGLSESAVKALAPTALRGNVYASKLKVRSAKDIAEQVAKVTAAAKQATATGKGSSADRKVVAKDKAAAAAKRSEAARKAVATRAAKKQAAKK